MATLQGLARPTDFNDLNRIPGGADHTYVTSSEGTSWGCGGGTNDGKVIVSGQGSHKLAKLIARNDYGGMSVYGTMGVCHQMANRVLYPCGRNVHRAKGAGWSYTIYGIYGKPESAWLAWKTECEVEAGVIPIPYGVPLLARVQSPRWPGFVVNPRLDLAAIAASGVHALRPSTDPEILEFSEDEWQDKEILTVSLLAEAAGASPEEIANAEFESFLKVRTDGRIPDRAIREIFQVRADFERERNALHPELRKNGEAKSELTSLDSRLVAAFVAIEKILGSSLYEQIYDLPPDHSPDILYPSFVAKRD
jgi:hypothetical protein